MIYKYLRNFFQIYVFSFYGRSVNVGFIVMSDFVHYRSGVYQSETKRPSSGHAVKIIGWGTEKTEKGDVKYWSVSRFSRTFLPKKVNV